MKKLVRRLSELRLRPKLPLIGFMIFCGFLTAVASINTYEVVSRRDLPFSSVIKTIRITGDDAFNNSIVALANQNYSQGNFGIPKKIRFPESNQHIEIIPAQARPTGWLAAKGMGQVVLTGPPEQKVFGQAIIYLRYNTPTTQHLGNVLNDDIVNIVTSDGWQLGYQVFQTTSDPSHIDTLAQANKSRILVIMVNDQDGSRKSFYASLVKVGERL